MSITIQAASKHQGPEIKMGPGQKSDPSKKKQGSGGAGTETPEDEVRGENTVAYMCVCHRVCCQIMLVNNIATKHFCTEFSDILISYCMNSR